MMGTFDSNIIVTEKIKLHKKTNKEGLGSIVEARSAEQSGINSCNMVNINL